MKKKFQFLFFSFLLFLAFFPSITFASRYHLEETDLSLLLDDDSWYVFTRGNIKDNEELEELGVSYDYLSNLMDENLIYLDAVHFSDESDDMIELFVRKKSGSKVESLSTYSKAELKLLEKELANNQDSPTSEIYENDYKFIYLEYQDSGYHLLEYYTIINNDAYTVTVQKVNDFTKEEKEEIRKTIDSMIFEVESKKEEETKKEEKEDSSILNYAIIGAIAGGIVGFLISLQNRKPKIKL